MDDSRLGPPGPAKGVAEVAAARLCSPVTRQGKGWLWCAHTFLLTFSATRRAV